MKIDSHNFEQFYNKSLHVFAQRQTQFNVESNQKA